MSDIRLLIVAGSSRSGSFNRKLAAVAAGGAREAGARVSELDLRSLALPIYDAEIEAAGMPEGALELRRQFALHDALLIASPEYNAFPTPLLINSLDWASRVRPAEGLPSGLAAMSARAVGLLSASPGGLGGLRGLIALRSFLALNLGMLVVPEQFALAHAGTAFDDDGRLIDQKHADAVHKVLGGLLRTASALKATR